MLRDEACEAATVGVLVRDGPLKGANSGSHAALGCRWAATHPVAQMQHKPLTSQVHLLRPCGVSMRRQGFSCARTATPETCILQHIPLPPAGKFQSSFSGYPTT
jgi:hypothetical protein